MLPDRSKRFASVEGDLPRLRLAEGWQLFVIAVIILGLLTVIFPHRALVEKLYNQERLDELTLSYIENLHRTDPTNADLSILLGRARQNKQDIAALEKLLRPAIATGDARQRSEARMLLLEAYERAMEAHSNQAQSASLRTQATSLLEAARRDEVPPRLAGAFAASAFRLERPAIGVEFMQRIAAKNTVEVLTQYAREALGEGRHALAAECFLLARKQVGDREQARELFQQGIGAYLAASLFQQAMQAAERDLGDLADDPPTLRFLARSALAAGDPQAAAAYARRLIFIDEIARPGARR